MAEHFAYDTVSLVILMILAIMVKLNSVLDKRKKASYYLATGITAAVTLAELVSKASEAGPHLAWANNFANMIGFSFSPFIPMLLIFVFSTDYSKRMSVTYIPLGINLILTVSSPITGLIYSVSATNVYSRGPMFWFYVVTCVWSAALLFRHLFSHDNNNYKKNRTVYTLLYAFIIAGTAVQIAFPAIHTAWICVSVSMIASYAFNCEFGDRHDSLTTLYNRREFEIEKHTITEKEKATVIMFDVDDFKKINDNFGHAFGDYCLNVIGKTIGDVFSDNGMGFRIGGDEFCVISGITDEADISAHLKSFLSSINFHRAKNSDFPMVSFGYAMYYKASIDTIDDVINSADSELYRYKRIHKARRKAEETP